MLKVVNSECLKDDIAVCSTVISFLGIPLFKRVDTTTNNQVVQQLKVYKHKKIKGFKHETEN